MWSWACHLPVLSLNSIMAFEAGLTPTSLCCFEDYCLGTQSLLPGLWNHISWSMSTESSSSHKVVLIPYGWLNHRGSYLSMQVLYMKWGAKLTAQENRRLMFFHIINCEEMSQASFPAPPGARCACKTPRTRRVFFKTRCHCEWGDACSRSSRNLLESVAKL